MGWFSSKKKVITNPIVWKQITSVADLNEIVSLSNDKVIAIFKHSTRCSISVMAKSRFERAWNYNSEVAVPVYLDLIGYRDVSNVIADQLGIPHASPQLIILKNEQVMLHSSHNAIQAKSLESFL